ncbi:VIT family protein [Demequina sp. NBRC 110056]|uniref:VIT1/CCC1 transporter family protein n=1 Tax=Demequina sp. NBRC 110056 TaxID=1570345 RepID=UPI0009FF5E18|nr:VIT family protein [Demequina sp. NBRC 110056]
MFRRREPEHIDEEAVSGRLNALRAGVLGANDGIVSIAGLVIGVAAAAPTNHGAILAAGVAGLTAGALSMGVGEYVSVSSQRDAERAQLRREKGWHRTRPDWELEQLVQLNMDTGMSEETARAAAIEQTAHDPVAIHALMHLGIDPDELTNPWHAGIASLLAFTLGGILPLGLILLATPALQVPVTFVAVVLALALTGFVSARIVHASVRRAVVRNVVGGSLAMAITYGVGHLVGVAV